MKERIREIAGELIKTAAERALRPGAVAEPDTGYAAFADRFPYEETEDQDRAIADVVDDLGAGQADGPAGLRRRRLRQDRGRAARRLRRGDGRPPGRPGLPDHPARPPALSRPSSSASSGFPIEIGRLSRLVPAAEAKATREGLAAGKIDIVIGTHAVLAKSVEFKQSRPRHRRRGAAFRRHPQGAAEGAARRRPRPHPHRDADPAHAADGDVGPARAVGDPDAAGRSARGAHLCHAVGSGGGPRGAAARTLSRRAELLRRARASPTCPTSSNSCARRCPRSATSPRTARWRRPRSRSGCRPSTTANMTCCSRPRSSRAGSTSPPPTR